MGLQGPIGPTGVIGSSVLTTFQCSNSFVCACPAGTLLVSAGASCNRNQYLYRSQPQSGSLTAWEARCEVFSDGAEIAPAQISMICATDADPAP